MKPAVMFSLSFNGEDADRHEVDLYDVARALVGFQRSLALTTHLVINDEIITQAPHLQNATIRAFPPNKGSWEILAGVSVAATATYYLGTAPKDTPIGHLIYSVYDYIVKATLGVHVNYDKSLGQQYDELKSQQFEGKILTQNRVESLIEKCEPAIKELHRPIAGRHTAETAQITARGDGFRAPVGVVLNGDTYEYLDETFRSGQPYEFKGRVSSYNSNTYKGRVFIPSEGRPVGFELRETVRDAQSLGVITSSLSANTLQPRDRYVGYFYFSAFTRTSRTGLIKALEVISIRAGVAQE